MSDESPVDRTLAEILRVEPIGEGAFEARVTGFGAETMGCAALAAARTCEGRALHSVQACFLRPAPADEPLRLDVAELSSGRRLARRRVTVRHGGRVLLELLASFAAPAEGVAFQDLLADSDVPAPDALPPEAEVARAEGWSDWYHGPLEFRWVGRPWDPAPDDTGSRYVAWVRPRLPLGDDRALHAAAVVYASDYHSHWPVARKLRAHYEPQGYTSLDQVVWLHEPVHWDDWWLLASEAVVARGGRALGHRTLYTGDGRLVASMSQEALIPPA